MANKVIIDFGGAGFTQTLKQIVNRKADRERPDSIAKSDDWPSFNADAYLDYLNTEC